MSNMRVLELRIHGIANSPPAEILCTTEEEVERKDGDDQGSFWRIKPKKHGRIATAPVDDETVIEAYSWGNQARSGGSALALVGRAIVHVSWLFVLPFGLCNLAYWARRDIKGADEEPKWWAGGDGAVMVRIFALLQTLFYTVGFLTVFVHLMALQCFRSVTTATGAVGYQTCAALPRGLDFLAEWSPTARAALFSVVPIVVILLIYMIGLRARGMFNPQSSFDDDARPRPMSRAPQGEADPPRPALLATLSFWHRSRVAQTSERAHFAAAIALIVFLLGSDALLDSLPDADPFDVLVGGLGSVAASPAPFAAVVAGAVLLAGSFVITAAAGLSGKIWSVRSKRGWSTLLLVLSAGAFVLWIGWALLVARDDVPGDGHFAGNSSMQGLIATPTVIAAAGALIAVGSLSWGYRWRRRLVMWLVLPLAFVCAVSSAAWAKGLSGDLGWVRPALSVATVILVVLGIIIAYLPFRNAEVKAARRLSGWHGNGAAVSLLLALLASLVITSLFVLGTHAWLVADNDTPTVTGSWRTVDESTSEAIAAPGFHERFAGMLVVVLLVIIVVGLGAAVAALRRYPAFSLPGPLVANDLGGVFRLVADGQPAAPHPAAAPPAHAPQAFSASSYPPEEDRPSGRLRAVADARRIAGLAHRGEPLLRVLAALTAVALVPLAIPYIGEIIEQQAAWSTLSAVSGWAIGLLGLAAVAWVVTNAVTSKERPLGLVWDIICFFPRAGHPFAPPCYAERAVPEVTQRIKRWMAEEGKDARVIVSAHSMGATIAVGAILALHGEDEDDVLDRVALLTHGVQLRPYFSRFFPEVFGARILGVRGTRGPSLLGADPWRRQVIDDSTPPESPLYRGSDPASLVHLLGGDFRDPSSLIAPRWRSLWRRTDYLGFPVHGYWSNAINGVNENPIDRGATERAPRSYLWTVARHNDYLSTPQYRSARHELVEMMKGGS